MNNLDFFLKKKVNDKLKINSEFSKVRAQSHIQIQMKDKTGIQIAHSGVK